MNQVDKIWDIKCKIVFSAFQLPSSYSVSLAMQFYYHLRRESVEEEEILEWGNKLPFEKRFNEYAKDLYAYYHIGDL